MYLLVNKIKYFLDIYILKKTTSRKFFHIPEKCVKGRNSSKKIYLWLKIFKFEFNIPYNKIIVV